MAEELPKSITKKFEALEESLNSLQNSLKPFLKIPITDVKEKVMLLFVQHSKIHLLYKSLTLRCVYM